VVTPVRILGVFGGKDFRYICPNGDHVQYVVTLFECRIVENGETWTDPETKSLGYFAHDEMPPLALPVRLSMAWQPLAVSVQEASIQYSTVLTSAGYRFGKALCRAFMKTEAAALGNPSKG
jgi:hypothetical protein